MTRRGPSMMADLCAHGPGAEPAYRDRPSPDDPPRTGVREPMSPRCMSGKRPQAYVRFERIAAEGDTVPDLNLYRPALRALGHLREDRLITGATACSDADRRTSLFSIVVARTYERPACGG